MIDPETAARRVHVLLYSKGYSLSVAESCTGGMIANLLTDIPGASRFFLADIVAYSVGIKVSLLGVSNEVLHRFGVVSREMAEEMARCVREKTGSLVGLATTGNLGPDALENKPAGLVYVAVSTRDTVRSVELKLQGNRSENKAEAVVAALSLLREVVQEMG